MLPAHLVQCRPTEEEEANSTFEFGPDRVSVQKATRRLLIVNWKRSPTDAGVAGP